MKIRVLMAVLALAATVSTPALACSFSRRSPAELQRDQGRTLRQADLIFLARVIGYGTPTDTDMDITIVFYEPVQMVSDGALPASLSMSFIEICAIPPPPVGDVQVILMREADLSDANRSGTAGLTSTILGAYDIENVRHPNLRRRVNRALQRANIE
jgi:hypothetical protein